MLTREESGAAVLTDDDGRVVARTWLEPVATPPRAEVLTAVDGAEPALVAQVARADLAGMRVSTTDAAVADALVAAGGRVVRHATTMSLTHATTTPAGSDDRVVTWGLAPAGATTPTAVAAASVAAYTPEHPDTVPGEDDLASAAAGIASIIAGDAVGDFVPGCSGVVLDGGAVVGAILITVLPPAPAHDWGGGTWIADVFVAASHAGLGLGRALLAHAVDRSAAGGHERMGLAVTEGNPARRLYDAAGFVPDRTSWSVLLPEAGA